MGNLSGGDIKGSREGGVWLGGPGWLGALGWHKKDGPVLGCGNSSSRNRGRTDHRGLYYYFFHEVNCEWDKTVKKKEAGLSQEKPRAVGEYVNETVWTTEGDTLGFA
jgi:hypothetical protein